MDGGSFFGTDRATARTTLPDDLKRRLKRCGVSRGLVASITALQYEIGTGNDQALRLASDDPFFVPMAIVNPAAWNRRDGLIRRLKQDGHVAIGAFPHVAGNGGDFDDLTLRQIAEASAEADLPLFLGLAQRTDFAKVARNLAPTGVRLALRWMRGSGYGAYSEALAVADAFPNIFLDAGMAVQHGGIELLVREIGAGRLFVAANAPYAYPACPYFLVHGARIGDTDRQAILGGTLSALLGVPARPAEEPAGYRALIGAPKIDTLYNIGSFDIVEPEADDAAVADSIGRFGADIAIVSSMRAIFDDMRAGNAEMMAFLDRAPNARGLVAINPLDPAGSLAEIERHATDPRIIGVKTIQDDAYGLGLDDPRYDPLFSALAARPGFTVMAHPTGLGAAARRHPRLRFVSEHGTWRHRENADIPNIDFDICTSTPLVAQTDIADLIARAGAGRVLYASDAPLMSPAFTLGKLASLDLDAGVLAGILRGNATRAFPRLRANAV